MQLDDDQWKQKLTDEQYKVLREKGTEAPYSGEFVYKKGDGMFHCAACDNALFSSDTQYESTLPGLMGWPSFSEAATGDAVKLQPDSSLGMERTEVVCANCGGHLGHLFDDPTSPNGKHFCINSVSLDFKPVKKDD